jgi:hypothetical protein
VGLCANFHRHSGRGNVRSDLTLALCHDAVTEHHCCKRFWNRTGLLLRSITPGHS